MEKLANDAKSDQQTGQINQAIQKNSVATSYLSFDLKMRDNENQTIAEGKEGKEDKVSTVCQSECTACQSGSGTEVETIAAAFNSACP